MPEKQGPPNREEKNRSISIPVKPAVLVWARESMGRTIKEVASHLGESEELVKDWEAGQMQPTLSQLKTLARFYKRPQIRMTFAPCLTGMRYSYLPKCGLPSSRLKVPIRVLRICPQILRIY